MEKTVFSKLDKEGFEYALGIDNLSIKEMHTLMWLFGKRKNKYGGYFKKDKDDVYRSMLDNIDNWKDIAKRKILNMRNKSYNDVDINPDLSNMDIASHELLKQDEVFYESLKTKKLIKAISEGVKNALNEISDDLIRRAIDKADKLGYDSYANHLRAKVDQNYRVFAKYEFPEEDAYVLLVEMKDNETNIYEKNYFIVIGVTRDYYSESGKQYDNAMGVLTIKINANGNLAESFFDDPNISLDSEEVNDKGLTYTVKSECIYKNILDIPFSEYFSYFIFNGKKSNVLKPINDYTNYFFRNCAIYKDSNFKGNYSINKIIRKVFPVLRKHCNIGLNIKHILL